MKPTSGHKRQGLSQVETQLQANADRADVFDGLDWLEKGSEESDVNLLFLAGHGVTDENGYFYYLATDARPTNLRATAVGSERSCQHTLQAVPWT